MHRSSSFAARHVFKVAMCLTNAISLMVLLGEMEAPADYELLVNPLGIAAWLTVAAAVAMEYRYVRQR